MPSAHRRTMSSRMAAQCAVLVCLVAACASTSQTSTVSDLAASDATTPPESTVSADAVDEESLTALASTELETAVVAEASNTDIVPDACEAYWPTNDPEFSERCEALIECIESGWGPPDGSEFLLEATLWGGETPHSALNAAASEPGAEMPVIWTGENYGIDLDPMRSVTADDIARLLRSAADQKETEPRRVTSTFTHRFADPAPGSRWAEVPYIYEMDTSWVGSGVVDSSGSWFLDIADLDRPAQAPPRVGEISGQAFKVPAPPICPSHTPPGGLAVAPSPFTGYTDEVGDVGHVARLMLFGSMWRQLIAAALEPIGAALIDASRAETVPGEGDVFLVGVAMDQPISEWLNTLFFLSGMGIDLDTLEIADWPDDISRDDLMAAISPTVDVVARFEIGADGRLLSAEWDLTEWANEMFAANMTVLLPVLSEEFNAEELDLLLGDFPSLEEWIGDWPVTEKMVWRTTWRSHGASGLEVSQWGPGVWSQP